MAEQCGCGAARVEGLPTCGPCTVSRLRASRDAGAPLAPVVRVLLAAADVAFDRGREAGRLDARASTGGTSCVCADVDPSNRPCLVCDVDLDEVRRG